MANELRLTPLERAMVVETLRNLSTVASEAADAAEREEDTFLISATNAMRLAGGLFIQAMSGYAKRALQTISQEN